MFSFEIFLFYVIAGAVIEAVFPNRGISIGAGIVMGLINLGQYGSLGWSILTTLEVMMGGFLVYLARASRT